MLRPIALLLTTLTGFSALVYEVAWQKYLATLLGSHSEATAAVLAIFLGGLSAGYAVFGALTRRLAARARAGARRVPLLSVYGALEAGIGLHALLFPLLFGLAQRLSLFVPPGHPGAGFGFDVTLAALLIGPPALLMGATIPFLTLALAPDLERATRIHAWVYGLNTAGAFLGALAGGFFIVPRLGLDGSVYAMGVLNIAAGAAFFALDRRVGGTALEPETVGAAEPARGVGAYAAVALLAGFAMMSLQTTLNRLGALALGASHFTFAMVVAVFVLCIALGSLAVSALPRVPPRLLPVTQWLLFAWLLLAYRRLDDLPYWAHALRAVFQQNDGAFYPFYLNVLLALLALLVVPIGLSGMLLPLLFHQLRRERGELGGVAGRLYAWNTVGSLFGALLGGYVLLLWLDLHHVYRIALAAIALCALLLTSRVARPLPGWAIAAALLPLLVALALLPPWRPERLTAGLFRMREALPLSFRGPDAFFASFRPEEILFYDDDPTSTVSVQEIRPEDGPPNRSIVVNGKSDGSLVSDYATMALAALVPALIADSYQRAFVIGLGTGVSTGELAALRGSRQIEVAEISRGVIAAAPLFDDGNLFVSRSPKLTVRRGDAYRTLLQSHESYDLIVSEPSNPWVTGVEMLYSIEFLEAARARLAPGGVYAQWFHTYEIDDKSVELVFRNYASVFPNVSVWFAMGGDVLLLGIQRPGRALDLPALERRFHQPDFAAGFARVGIDSFPRLLAHELLPLGALRADAHPGPLHTLRHPILSQLAARAFFRGGTAELPRFVGPESARDGARNSLLRRYAGVGDGPLPEPLLQAATRETCRFGRLVECATFFAAWRHEYAGSPQLARALAQARRAAAAGHAAQANLLADASLDPLVRLLGADGPLPAARRPLVRADAMTAKFLRHYHHAVPFDRRVLAAVWRECTSPRCEARRREVEAQVGPLDVAAIGG